MKIWRPLDAIAEWVQRMPIKVQERVAVMAILISLCLFIYMPFAGEPPIIYAMSAFALVFSGVTGLWALESQRKKKEDE
jgi:nucleoside recognition membrane protein YjiH